MRKNTELGKKVCGGMNCCEDRKYDQNCADCQLCTDDVHEAIIMAQRTDFITGITL